jgi:hypothetical protein
MRKGKHVQYPNLTRQQLREYSFSMAHLHLPNELEDHLLSVYNEVDFLDSDGFVRNYTEEDIWFGLQKSIMEYAQIKKQMDKLLVASEFLGNIPLTIKVQNANPSRWTDETLSIPI